MYRYFQLDYVHNRTLGRELVPIRRINTASISIGSIDECTRRGGPSCSCIAKKGKDQVPFPQDLD